MRWFGEGARCQPLQINISIVFWGFRGASAQSSAQERLAKSQARVSRTHSPPPRPTGCTSGQCPTTPPSDRRPPAHAPTRPPGDRIRDPLSAPLPRRSRPCQLCRPCRSYRSVRGRHRPTRLTRPTRPTRAAISRQGRGKTIPDTIAWRPCWCVRRSTTIRRWCCREWTACTTGWSRRR